MKVPRFTTQDLRNSNLIFRAVPIARARVAVSSRSSRDGLFMQHHVAVLHVSDFCHIFVRPNQDTPYDIL
jgi:hypothetical protein